METDYTILLFYKYVHIEDPEAVRVWQRDLCEKLHLTGRLIIAHEGLNVTLEGKTSDVEAYIAALESDPRFLNIHLKKSVGTGNAFPKLSVKVRPEIVSLHLEEDIDPNQITGTHLKPLELKQWYESGKEFYVIDMRNDYEFRVGRFKDSVLMPVQNFRDIPSALAHISHLKEKTVIPVCTGGVRCEKASGLLVREGFKDVYQLDGGIVSYMKEFPAQEFEGSLYVFDRRVTMDFDPKDKHVVVGTCDLCGGSTETYANCGNKKCNGRLLCCVTCRGGQKAVFCNNECRKKAVYEASADKRVSTFLPWVLQKKGYIVFYLLFRFFMKLEVKGREHIQDISGPCIFAANHTHELDPTVFPLVFPLWSHFFPIFFVTNATEKYKTFGWRGYIYGGAFFKALGGYPVFSGRKDYAYALSNHIEILKQGHSVCMFPEGKRARDGQLGSARGGLGYLAEETGVQVVPVAIDTFYNLSWKDFFLRRSKLTVTIGKPFSYGDLFERESEKTVEIYQHASQKVLDRIGEMLK